MHEFDHAAETACNPDCVYVPAQGWWCRQCGVFRDLDDTDLCADCAAESATVPSAVTVPRRRRPHE